MIINTLVVIGVFVIFYFAIVRPLRKKYGSGSYKNQFSDYSNWTVNPSDPRYGMQGKYKQW